MTGFGPGYIVQQLIDASSTFADRQTVDRAKLALRLQRISTVDEVASVLEKRILAGELPSGSWLREVELAEELEVSRNTLRQALQALTRAGLVEHLPHRGVRVTTLDGDDVADILRARRCLEDGALARCEAPAKLGERLLAIAERMENAASGGEWSDLVDLDLGYHRAIVGSLGSERLGVFFDDVLRELRLAFILIDRREAESVESLPHVGDHRSIATALMREDVGRARSLLRRHLDESEERLSGLVRPDP